MKKWMYDLIVVGGSVAGSFAAKSAAQQGAKVLLIESRPYLGREFTATWRPWIGAQGLEQVDEEISTLFDLPQEQENAVNEEIPFQIGYLKKQLLSSLRSVGVDILFQSGVAGVITADHDVCGVVIGNKSGFQAITAKKVIDATENNTVLLHSGQPLENTQNSVLVKRSFELTDVQDLNVRKINVPKTIHVTNQEVNIHQGHMGSSHVIVEFSFTVDLQKLSFQEKMDWEIEAREKTIALSEYLLHQVPEFKKAKFLQSSGELWYVTPNKYKEHTMRNLLVLETDQLLFEQQDLQSLVKIKQQTEAETARLCADLTAGQDADREKMRVLIKDLMIPLNELNPTFNLDPIFNIPYYEVTLTNKNRLPALQQHDVLVVGGGTAGAPAAIAAAREGADVLLIEGTTGLGGTGTLGGVNVYYFGYKGGFTAKLDEKVKIMNDRINQPIDKKRIWNVEAKMMTFLDEITTAGGKVWYRSTAVDVIKENNTISGVVVLTPEGLHVVHSKVFIDGTGDGDLAVLAGVPHVTGDAGGNLQTFNLSSWKVASTLAGLNLDLGVVDVNNVFDVTRGIMIGHIKGEDYDFSPYLSVRESRHVEGDYQLKVQDVLSQKIFPDTIAIGSTDFDQHGLQSSPFARIGYLPYHRESKKTRLPYRALLPKGVDNLFVIGKAFSAERDAFSFMRMQADFQNVGYAIGMAATMANREGVKIREINLPKLQQTLQHLGIISAEDIGENDKSITAEVIKGADDAANFLQIICQPKESILPQLKEAFSNEQDEQVRLALGMALAWFGDATGVDEMIAALEVLRHEKQADAIDSAGVPIGGFIDQPDAYWKVNQLITLLGMAGDPKALDILIDLVKHTDAGGPKREHRRLHWRRVRTYDRIISLCFAIEALADPKAASALEELIKKPDIGGFVTKEGVGEEGVFASAYLEMVIAVTLAKCGSEEGIRVLKEYLDDVHIMLSNYAHAVLLELTGVDYRSQDKIKGKFLNEGEGK